MRRILVTRPEPGASRTAARLAELGFQPVVLPLTRIEPLPVGAWPEVSRFEAVAVASANAVRHAPGGLLAQLARLPVYAVGETTAEAAQQAGLSVARSSAGDAAGLVQHIVQAVAPGGSVLLLCGRVRRDILESGLSAAGIKAEPVETYDTVPLSPSEGALGEVMAGGKVYAVLLYSAFAAEEFVRLMERSSAARLCGDAILIAISKRVADVLPGPARDRARVAGEPTEEAMISLLAGPHSGSVFFRA